MEEYHCNFCNATGTKLRNEEKGCCNACGAPLEITKEAADKVYKEYYERLPAMSTAFYYPANRITEAGER